MQALYINPLPTITNTLIWQKLCTELRPLIHMGLGSARRHLWNVNTLLVSRGLKHLDVCMCVRIGITQSLGVYCKYAWVYTHSLDCGRLAMVSLFTNKDFGVYSDYVYSQTINWVWLFSKFDQSVEIIDDRAVRLPAWSWTNLFFWFVKYLC